MPKIVVVCGYGCHLNDQLRGYLDRVCKHLNENHFDHLILCGGATQKKSAPGKTEAKVMGKYLVEALNIRKAMTMPCSLEENSYTTYYNIQGASRIIREKRLYDDGNPMGLVSTEIVIFCEATRSPNVIMLARHFMMDFVRSIDYITVETASWERADPFKQAGNLIYNKLAITFPRLGLAEREQRRRIKHSYYI